MLRTWGTALAGARFRIVRAPPALARWIARASRFGPHLVLTQHGDAGGELAIRYLAGIRVEIGAARHDDLIFRALIDADHRDSGRPARSGDGGAVDPGRGHRLARKLPKLSSPTWPIMRTAAPARAAAVAWLAPWPPAASS